MKKSKTIKKNEKPLTIRERRLIKGIGTGLSVAEAARRAGYAESTVDKRSKEIIGKNRVKQAINNLMDSQGLTDDFLLERHRDLLEATKAVSVISGKDAGVGTLDFVDVPDWPSRAKGLDMAYKLKGHYSSEKIDISLPVERYEQRRKRLGLDE